MTLTPRDRRALLILAAAGTVWALLQFVILPDRGPAARETSLSSAELRKRVAVLRQTAALLPVREALLKQANADIADRDRGTIQAATAAEAQAQLVLTAQRVGKANDIDVRGGDSPPPKIIGEYGVVYSTITFECHIEQLLNFLADLTREQELIVPSQERISSGSTKEKLTTVRMVMAGIVDRKLIPEKKGVGSF